MIIRWLIGHDSKEIIKTILEISEKLYGLTKSITSDHGKEFTVYKGIGIQRESAISFTHNIYIYRKNTESTNGWTVRFNSTFQKRVRIKD